MLTAALEKVEEFALYPQALADLLHPDPEMLGAPQLGHVAHLADYLARETLASIEALCRAFRQAKKQEVKS